MAISNQSIKGGLPGLLDALDFFDSSKSPLPLGVIKKSIADLSLSLSDLEEYIHFDEKSYKRNLIRESSAYTALVLCWRSGQHSPIHNHRGSSCVVSVISGTLTEILFDQSPCGTSLPTKTTKLTSGAVVAAYDKDTHLMGNFEGPGSDLITLHVYSPALKQMELYPSSLTFFAGYDELVGRMSKDFPVAQR